MIVSKELLEEALTSVRQQSQVEPGLSFEAAQMAEVLRRAPRVEAISGPEAEAEARAAMESVMVQARAAVAAGRVPAIALSKLDAIEARGNRLAALAEAYARSLR